MENYFFYLGTLLTTRTLFIFKIFTKFTLLFCVSILVKTGTLNYATVVEGEPHTYFSIKLVV